MLIQLYKSMLNYAGLKTDKDGFIYASLGGKKRMIEVQDRSLVLPTSEQLRSFNSDEKTVFHPLAENILERGEPPIIKKFKEVINIRLNYTIGVVAQSLLNIVVSPELHKKLNTEQMQLLKCIPDADGKTLDAFISKMVSRMKTRPDKVFTNIYIKKGGVFEGSRCARVSVVMFPFFEELDDLKFRKKDKPAIEALFKYIFQDIDVVDSYNYGSNSRVAPCLDALMNGSLNIASKLNEVLDLYSDYIEDSEDLVFDSEWVEKFFDLGALTKHIRRIPVHGINEQLAEPEPIHQQQAPTTYPANAPVQAPAGPVITENNKLDYRSVPQYHNANQASILPPALEAERLSEQHGGIAPVFDAWGRPVPPPPLPQQQVDQWGRPVIPPQQPQHVFDQYGRIIG